MFASIHGCSALRIIPIRREGEAIVKAIRASGARHIVFLSSLGAELSAGTGPIAGLHAQEERLRELGGVDVLVTGLHLCQAMRGVKTDGLMATSALRGALSEGSARAEFLSLRR